MTSELGCSKYAVSSHLTWQCVSLFQYYGLKSFVQTTKKLYDYDYNHPSEVKRYNQSFLKMHNEKALKTEQAAYEEYLKFSADTLPDHLITLPSDKRRYYYIPEQHLLWFWRKNAPLKGKPHRSGKKKENKKESNTKEATPVTPAEQPPKKTPIKVVVG
ncbi:hypothetical protein CDAR_60821 [Caerostris darwini]|uniref:Uncharacterized protein n=1 Tax=Caerostris darwini TaxID=1538125 RepID=A0AAV4VIL3_9ARAC|nr:hypothetical protein CDAR_60821 [Caerostris darwini]